MKFINCVWLVGIAVVCGCGGPSPTRPGTVGTIHAGKQPIANIRVTFHRRDEDDSELIGFGVSDHNGKFRLFLEDAIGPLWLEPGEYAVTLESDGAEPYFWPEDYLDPLKTPLVQSWDGDEELALDVPEPASLPAGSTAPQRRRRG